MAANLGQQYGGDRDVYEALGYKKVLTTADYLTRYTRQDIAKAVIDRPAKSTWNGALELLESNKSEVTPLESAWKDLDEKLDLKTKFSRVDRLACIGQYAILLLGLDDVKKKDDFKTPVVKGKAVKLAYVKPFGELSAQIQKLESDPNNIRYGLPLYYNIQAMDVESNGTASVLVHYSRVIHIIGDSLESDVYGIPVLEAVFNRLMDLEKLVGGDAEMFWRGARPGYVGKVDKDYQMTDEMIEDLKNQANEFEHNLRRMLVNEGVDLKALDQQIADPSPHVDVQIQMLSSALGMPKRILVGSERGELSSAQDTGEYLSYIKARREEFAEVKILRPFVNRCIELEILPKAIDRYRVKWPDLFALSEKDKVEVGRNRAMALREYSTNPMAEAIIPPDAFLEYFLGLTEDAVELIQQIREKAQQEEMEMGGDAVLEAQLNPPQPKEPMKRGNASSEENK
jgi:hypothetical protein